MAVPFLITQKIFEDKNFTEFHYLKKLLDGRDRMFVTKTNLKNKISEIIFNTNSTAQKHSHSPIEIDSSRIRLDNYKNEFILISLSAKPTQSWLVDACKNRCIGIDIGEKNAISVVSNFEKPFVIRDPYLKLYFDIEVPEFTILVDEIFEYIQQYIKIHKVQTVYLGKITSGMCGCLFRKLKKLQFANVEIIDETDTSQASFIDRDFTQPYPIKNQKYSGFRKNRDEYVSSSGKVIDADINASYNIVLKGNQFAFLSCLSTLELVPRIMSL